jgi:tetratricopeptide (TPR) repeat protein
LQGDLGFKDGPRGDRAVVEAERLLGEGRRLAARGDLAKAAEWFERAVKVCALPAALNNLALAHLEHHRDPDAALKILAPNLADAAPQPYAHALAARCLVRLGDTTEALRRLDASIRDFECAIEVLDRLADDALVTVSEYTAIILQAAGDVGDDRQVWTLYQRWQRWHVLPVCDFFAGTAVFNLGRFEQAARLWRRVRHPEWRFLAAYAGVAHLCAEGTVPPFRLPYAPPQEDQFAREVADAKSTPPEDVAARIIADPANLVMLLYNLFAPDAPMAGTSVEGKEAMISALVAGGREWGERLARSLFAASRAPTSWKMAALEGLHTASVVSLDEPVTMLIDGRSTPVALKRVELVTEPYPELEARYREALACRDAGRLDDARRALDPLVHGDRLYAPAVVAYANILRTQGEPAEARRLLELLREALPDHPVVLYNLAGVSAEEGDYKAACRYLEAIDADDLPPGLAEQLTALTERLEPYLLPEYLMERAEEESRRQVDERPISPGTLTLPRALDQIPADWLDAACSLHGLRSPARLRHDRARQLARLLVRDPAAAVRVLAGFDHDRQGRALLHMLLQRGGWARVGAITRRFGTDAGDGYFWAENPPASPLGRLRLACLVFVGRARVEGRRARVAVVPVDLRAALTELIDGI